MNYKKALIICKNIAKKSEVKIVILLCLFLRWYQLLISPYLGARCRFYPSCSQYFITSLNKRGILKGFSLGCRRLLRCHPFADGGYDPVSKDN